MKHVAVAMLLFMPLAAGANPLILPMQGNLSPRFPTCNVTRNAGQAVPDDTAYHFVNWPTEAVDTHNTHNVSVNNHRVDIKESGYYLAIANIGFDTNANGARYLSLVDSTSTSFAQQSHGGDADDSPTHVAGVKFFTVGDWLATKVRQTAGVSLNMPVAAYNHMLVQRLKSSVGARVSRVIEQVIPDATMTVVNWTAEQYDPQGMHDNAINNSRITIPGGQDGWYIAGLNHQWDPNGTGYRLAVLGKNGAIEVARSRVDADGTSLNQVLFVDKLAAGDYIESAVFHNTGSNTDLDAGPDSSMYVHKLADSATAIAAAATKTVQSINNNADTLVTWDLEQEDSDNFHSDVTNNSRFTAPYKGRYFIAATTQWANTSLGLRTLRFQKNGTDTVARATIKAHAQGEQTLSTVVTLNQGDYIETFVLQDSGSAQNLRTAVVGSYGTFYTRFVIFKMD